MKQKIAGLVLVFLLIIILVGSAYLLYDNERLNEIIVTQNNFIKDVTGKDSVFINQSKKYRDSLDNFTKKFTYYLDGKVVNSEQFFAAYKLLQTQKDSITYMYDHAKKLYGFDIESRHINDSTIVTRRRRFTRADSADITYYFFKDRIRKDKRNTWSADQTSAADIKEVNKKLEELAKKAKLVIDSNRTN